MPGHAGVTANKYVDRLASIATVGGAMDQADILNAIREAGQEKDVGNDCECANLSRLQDCQVKNPDKSIFKAAREDW